VTNTAGPLAKVARPFLCAENDSGTGDDRYSPDDGVIKTTQTFAEEMTVDRSLV
jgi:hypothetical protein